MSRPKSVTIISILAIIFGLYSLAVKIFVVSSTERYQQFLEFAEALNSKAIVSLPVEVHLAHGLIGSFMWIVSGIFMLKGKNWARLLALFWGFTVLVLTFFVGGFSILLYLKSAMYLILLYFLTHEKCLVYFQGKEQAL